MSNIEPWQSAAPGYTDWRSRSIIRQVNHEVLAEHGRAVVAAKKAQNVISLCEGVMTGLDSLRRHEARAASEDPMVSDEYARIRRLGADLGMNIINQYGSQPWL